MYEILLKLMERAGVDIETVSEKTGIPMSIFIAWEAGEYQPKTDKLMKLAKYFGVPLSIFYGGDIYDREDNE